MRIGVFISLVEPFKSIRVVSNETWVIFMHTQPETTRVQHPF